MSEEFRGSYLVENIPNKAWTIRRYSRREGSKWNEVHDDGSGMFSLHTKSGQLILVQNGTVYESLPLINQGQLHGVFRGDTLLIGVRHENIGRKFKVCFESTQAAADCIIFLRRFFPIRDVSKPEENIPVTLGQMYTRLMQLNPADLIPSPQPLPPSFPLDEMVKMCILDPSFPDLVARVGAVVSRIDTNNK